MAIHVEKFDDAEKFLHELRMSSPRWGNCNGYVSDWVFRGQGDAAWPLLPSLWRCRDDRDKNPFWRQSELEATSLVDKSRIVDAIKRPRWIEIFRARLAEAWAVWSFWRLADALGLEADKPPDLIGADKDVPKSWLVGEFTTFQLEPSSTTALAQHHGIQTRLLDCARHSYVAAYFAASTMPLGATRLAVWAIRESRLAAMDKRLQVLSYPRSRNRYLHAQSGVFLFHRDSESTFAARGTWPCIGDSIESSCGERSIIRLELEAGQAPRLLQLLMAEQFSHAHLMPSLDNVATTVKAIANTQEVDVISKSTGGG
ncbi:MAG: FRG domain-containing protein [Phycisphaeraceae bacterium]|nr:FRG domain-containing protein [Phycisphaeraceae bacterium]MBX3368110.1 FRG domain-containing protein [Phycisphaeraceae bacterium]QYK47984.1 MAG: FRG domain-containing protein [Phycisphaeraceae bacterium]